MAVDPIHQFQIIDLFPVAKIGNTEIAFTNSAAYMVAAVVIITAFLLGGTAKRSLVPGRVQSTAELTYEFVANTIKSTAGTEGMRFFPFVFALFTFILTVNIVGLIPYAFTVTTHIIITCNIGDVGLPDGPRLWILEARASLLQPVRAQGHTDLHPAAHRIH